jgi:hypothetical protein
VLKVGARGKPKMTSVLLMQQGDSYALTWASRTKAEAPVLIIDGGSVAFGHDGGLFKAYADKNGKKKKHPEHFDADACTRSISLICDSRSFDFVVPSYDDFDVWSGALMYLVYTGLLRLLSSVESV